MISKNDQFSTVCITFATVQKKLALSHAKYSQLQRPECSDSLGNKFVTQKEGIC